MKAIKYLDELIEFEENYQTGYEKKKDIPLDSKKRLKDLKEAREELVVKGSLNLSERVSAGLDRELKRQKKAGKKFLSDEEIDTLIDGIIKEELGDGWKEHYT